MVDSLRYGKGIVATPGHPKKPLLITLAYSSNCLLLLLKSRSTSAPSLKLEMQVVLKCSLTQLFQLLRPKYLVNFMLFIYLPLDFRLFFCSLVYLLIDFCYVWLLVLNNDLWPLNAPLIEGYLKSWLMYSQQKKFCSLKKLPLLLLCYSFPVNKILIDQSVYRLNHKRTYS